jgi:pyridoxamine 5'-phosphate oxidase family protein
MFSEPEVRYLKSQRLARLATVNRKGQPDVVPVGFEFDGKYFWVGSHSQDILVQSMKYLNVKNGNKLVSLAIDDLETVDPWKPREVKVYGEAEIADHPGRFGPGKYLRITPKISWSFGIPGMKTEGPGWGRVKTIHR